MAGIKKKREKMKNKIKQKKKIVVVNDLMQKGY